MKLKLQFLFVFFFFLPFRGGDKQQSKEKLFGLKKNLDLTPNELEINMLKSPFDTAFMIEKICKKIFDANTNPNIFLIRKKEVIQWLFGDLSFLPPIEKKNKTSDEIKYKELEDKWGREIMKIRRPDLKLDKQWTNKFGEYICEEIYSLLGKVVSKPIKKEQFQPDLEVDDAIIEVKTGTFYTSGTAVEKILGCPLKYAEIPRLYGKPLKIFCIGGAEKIGRETYGIFPGEKCTPTRKKFLDGYQESGIEYIGATDILISLVNNL